MVLFENIFFLLCRKNHTLAKTITSDGDHTITGCQVGQPVFFVHKCNKIVDYPAWVFIRDTSGTATSRAATYHHYCIGTTFENQWGGSTNIFCVIATATSVTVNTSFVGDNDNVLVYN